MLATVLREIPVSYYQSAAALLAVLLLSGVVTEIRTLRELADGSSPPSASDAVSLVLFLCVLAVVLLGEVMTLNVLVAPPASPLQQLVIGVCVLVGLLLIPTMSVGRAWRRFPERSRRRVVVKSAVLLFGTVSILFVVGSLIYTVATGSPGLGSPVVPSAPVAYRVKGTCADGACGLAVRDAPRLSASYSEVLDDDTVVAIACQRTGDEVNGSKIWDRISNGGWIADYFVTTAGGDDEFTDGIPGCGHGPQG